MRWEYKVIDYPVDMNLTPEELEKRLNELGKEGWGACAGSGIRVIFKREKTEEEEQSWEQYQNWR